MRRISIILFLASLLVGPAAQAKLKVVSSLPDFAAIAAELGGDRVEAESLVLPTQDPHYVDARPSYILKVNQADLLVVIGMGIEDGWLPVLLTQARNQKVQPGGPGYLDASSVIAPLEVPVKADRAMGDVHAAGNPHYFTSPVEMHKVARAIHDKLVALDPEGSAHYRQGWQRFDAHYQKRLAAWRAELAPLAGQKVVVYHQSWIYFISWAGLQRFAALEPKPGIPPSASHITRLIGQSRQQKIRQVWQELYHPNRLSKIFAKKTGARLLMLPSMTGAMPGTETLSAKFDTLVRLITQ